MKNTSKSRRSMISRARSRGKILNCMVKDASKKENSTAKSKKKSVSEAHSTSILDYLGKQNQSSRSRSRKEANSSDSGGENRRATTKTNSKTAKKRGLSERNTEVQVKTEAMKTKTKPQPKRKKTQPTSSATASTSSRGRSKKQKEIDTDDDQYTERVVSAQAAATWKPLSKASKQYVLDTMDSAIVQVLNETRPTSYDDVQDCLNILRQRIVGSLPTLSVPNVRQPDYRQMEEQCHAIEESVAESSNQVELLENEIDNQLRAIEEKERILEELKSDGQTTNRNQRHHPILQSTRQETLQLPAVKPSKGKHKQVPSTSTSNAHHKKLADVLSKWQSQDSTKDMNTFMDSLSNVASNLPPSK